MVMRFSVGDDGNVKLDCNSGCTTREPTLEMGRFCGI
jgi:hypothetical protein